MVRPNTHFESKKTELIKIAFGLFMEHGYENVTINHILKAAGISKGAMYHYFASKDEVLDAVLNYVIDVDMQRYYAVIEDLDLSCWEKILALFHDPKAKPAQEVQQANEYVLARPDSIFEYRARDLSVKRSVTIFSKLIESGVKNGEFQTDYPEETAEILYTAMQSMGQWVAINPTVEKIEREINALSDLFVQCLKLDHPKYMQLKEILTFQFKGILNCCLRAKGEFL